MKNILFFLVLLSSLNSSSQNKEAQEILDEGKLLFRLEKGSWYGTDDMLQRFKSKKDSVGGYLSYESANNGITTIFFSRFDHEKILIRYQFDSLPQPQPVYIDTLNNKATILEKDLVTLRQDAKEKVYVNEDDFFRFYRSTSFNIIPLIKNKERKVFILTGPKVPDVVLIGNDYRLTYNDNNEFVKKEKLHNSLLQFEYKSKNKNNTTLTTFHSHVTTRYISSTDICTLLLYKDYVEWNQHIVMSESDVSIFNLDKESLLTLSRKAWEKIHNSKKD